WDCAEIDEKLLGSFEGPRIGRFEPSETGDVVNAACLQREDDLSQIEPLHLGQFLLGPIEVLAFRPKPEAMPGSGPSGAAGALLSRRATDLLDEQGVDPASWIKSRYPREPAVDYHPDSVDRQRCLRYVSCHNGPALLI